MFKYGNFLNRLGGIFIYVFYLVIGNRSAIEIKSVSLIANLCNILQQNKQNVLNIKLVQLYILIIKKFMETNKCNVYKDKNVLIRYVILRKEITEKYLNAELFQEIISNQNSSNIFDSIKLPMMPYPIIYRMQMQMNYCSSNLNDEMLQSKKEMLPINAAISDLNTSHTADLYASLLHFKNSHVLNSQKKMYDFSICSSNGADFDKNEQTNKQQSCSNLKFTHLGFASENSATLSKCEIQSNSEKLKMGNLRQLDARFGECVVKSTSEPISKTNLSKFRNIASDGSNSFIVTCLHCRTVPRKTGIHQTTQTTDPISPISLNSKILVAHNDKNQSNLEVSCDQYNSNIILKSYTKESSISSFISTSNTNLPHGKEQHQQSQIQQINELKKKAINIYKEGNNCEHKLDNQFMNHFKAIDQRTFLRQKSSIEQNEHFHSNIERQKSIKKYIMNYIHKKISRFFGVHSLTEAEDFIMWRQRQQRFAIRRFSSSNSPLATKNHPINNSPITNNSQYFQAIHCNKCEGNISDCCINKRPDLLLSTHNFQDISNLQLLYFYILVDLEVKTSIIFMLISASKCCLKLLQNNNKQQIFHQNWSRSFIPMHIQQYMKNAGNDNYKSILENNTALQDEELFFNTQCLLGQREFANYINNKHENRALLTNITISKAIKTEPKMFLSERGHRWLINSQWPKVEYCNKFYHGHRHQEYSSQSVKVLVTSVNERRGTRIPSHFLDDIPENSHRPSLYATLPTINNLCACTDYRPFFTYWINTVQIAVMLLSILCYGIAPIGVGIENSSGQVLIPTLSIQKVQYGEPRNIWIGPRNNDLIHIGAKFATCMRRDIKITNVILKTRRFERGTACCIRNDDSGCAQSSQADCSLRGLYSMKSISTWKKWSLGESGPGGRISGSVCGLDPKYCDSPASVAPYEWPDDITKWPICRKTNSFSQRYRLKEHTAEHMVCEVIGHPCCTGVYGECQITTREYCDFVHGYFHEEASLCSQISCLNNICGMISFINVDVPDQFYRLFTSLCLHAGIFHLGITLFFQHLFLNDLERLIGSIRTFILYIGSGVAGNLTSAILLPYKAEVGPLASMSGVIASFIVLLTLTHWKQMHKPYIALSKLIIIEAILFAFGTLPWQLNFMGILAGIYCGVILTVTIVPFVNITQYRRKSKINLIWSCIIFHALFYTSMLVVFYIYPTEFNHLNLGDFFTNNFKMSTRENIRTSSSSNLNNVYPGSGKNYA